MMGQLSQAHVESSDEAIIDLWEGATALHLARNGHVAHALLAAGADVYLTRGGYKYAGWTPMHDAAALLR